MTDWQLRLPYRDRSDRFDPGAIAADIAQAIDDPDERQVARGVVLELATGADLETVGDALDALEGADPATRRALLDRARERAGLPSTARVDALKEAEAATRTSWNSPMRDSRGRVQALCSQPGCRAFLAGELSGSFKWVEARRWWCDEHRAGHEDDLEPYTGPRLGYSASGAIVDLDEQAVEAERARVQAETRRARYDAKQTERREDAERLAAFEAAASEQFRRESVVHRRP